MGKWIFLLPMTRNRNTFKGNLFICLCVCVFLYVPACVCESVCVHVSCVCVCVGLCLSVRPPASLPVRVCLSIVYTPEFKISSVCFCDVCLPRFVARTLILPIPVKNDYNRIISAGFAKAFLNNTRKSLSVFCLSVFANIVPYAKGSPGEDKRNTFQHW